MSPPASYIRMRQGQLCVSQKRLTFILDGAIWGFLNNLKIRGFKCVIRAVRKWLFLNLHVLIVNWKHSREMFSLYFSIVRVKREQIQPSACIQLPSSVQQLFPWPINAGCEAGTWAQRGASVSELTDNQPDYEEDNISYFSSRKWLKRFRLLPELQYNGNRALRIEKKMVHYLFFRTEFEYIVEKESGKRVCCATQRA